MVPLVQHGLLDQPEVRVAQDLQEERERRGQQSQRVHCRGPSYPVMHSLSNEQLNQAIHRMPKPPLCSGFATGDGGR
ncbi:hypothetical protein O4H29_20215 [Marinobacter salarius]|nr:hypothetical protein [Marinobacter salarius]MCZ4287163.1 hypothetical protein [Marinobacter salarius]